MVEIKTLLPLGSVVTLKKGTKKIMIVGRIQEDVKTHKQYDYAACYYPEGILDVHELFMFQQEDIEYVYYVGMQDEEEFAFRSYLAKHIEKHKKKDEEINIFIRL